MNDLQKYRRQKRLMLDSTTTVLCLVAAFLLFGLFASADDWPTRLYDTHRGGVTSEQLAQPLQLAWSTAPQRTPAPAWTESPALHDYYHSYYDMKPRQNFDACFDVAVVSNLVYYGSSRSGAIVCLDANGARKWRYFTGGAVRYAPHVANGMVFSGSDDGYVYCLDSNDGSLVWKERVGPTDETIWGNEHVMSVWPVRGSPMVVGADVYWAAGLFPEEGMYVCKRDAATGTGGWTITPSIPPQGYLLATAGRLYAPSGRTAPMVFTSSSGASEGSISGGSDGGCWAIVTSDESDIWTAPTVTGNAEQYNATTRSYIGLVSGANYLIADSTYAYYNTDTQIVKVNRSDRSIVWTKNFSYPHSLIMAGTHLFAGGDEEVAAFNASDGTRIWSHAINGKAYGLAVAGNTLYVSTDSGYIYSFSGSPAGIENTGASSITMNSADLNGYLTSTRELPTEVRVYWGDSDGGTNKAAWDNTNSFGICGVGALSTNVAALSESAANFYRFYASNSEGEAWAAFSSSFTTLADKDYFAYKARIIFPNDSRIGMLTNFPALVIFNTNNIVGFNYDQFASDTGGDLRFFDDAENNELAYEIEAWNANSNSYVWVNVPLLTSNTCIWAYWGNANATNPPSDTTNGAVWNSGYCGVWHMREGNIRDSTANANHGVGSGNTTAAGLVGGAQVFDGDNDQVTLSSALAIGNKDNTISAWVQVPTVGTGGLEAGERVGILLGNYDSVPNADWELHDDGQMRIYWNGGDVNSYDSTDLRDNAWHHLVWVRNRTENNFRMYIDGQMETIIADAGNDISFGTTHKIGGDNRTDPPNFHGLLDEFRISDDARSSNWIWACWMNVASNSAFSSGGSVTSYWSNADYDGDGMSDRWEKDHFDGATNATNGGAGEDWDGDGFVNLYEYIAGTSPTNRESYLSVDILLNGHDPVVRYYGIAATGGVYTGYLRQYDLEASTNVAAGGWSPVAGQTNVPGADAFTTYTNTSTAPIRFFRVKALLWKWQR